MTSLQKLTVALSAVLLSAPAMAIQPVPEPGTFGLMAVGLIAVVASTFRKRK